MSSMTVYLNCIRTIEEKVLQISVISLWLEHVTRKVSMHYQYYLTEWFISPSRIVIYDLTELLYLIHVFLLSWHNLYTNNLFLWLAYKALWTIQNFIHECILNRIITEWLYYDHFIFFLYVILTPNIGGIIVTIIK